MLCCASPYRSGRPRPRASANATRTLSTHGDWEGTPPSHPRVAEVQSAPTYWTGAGATPSDAARRPASSLPAHSTAQGLEARQDPGWRPCPQNFGLDCNCPHAACLGFNGRSGSQCQTIGKRHIVGELGKSRKLGVQCPTTWSRGGGVHINIKPFVILAPYADQKPLILQQKANASGWWVRGCKVEQNFLDVTRMQSIPCLQKRPNPII